MYEVGEFVEACEKEEKGINVESKIFEVGKQAALAAGQILMDNFRNIREVSKKADGSLVTNVDIEVERKVVDLIRDSFPEHGILTEESPEIKGDSEYRWIIDPLDGTHNYVHGLDIFGVSVCVTRLDTPIIGIVYLPPSGRLYCCEKGGGAYLNGRRIQVSQRKLQKACVAHNSNIRSGNEQMFEGFKKLAKSACKIRMFGSCVVSLSAVAEGSLDADIEYNVHSWDIYAGVLIIEEAGGKATDFSGNPWYLSGGPYIASNGLVHNEIRRLLEGIGQ